MRDNDCGLGVSSEKLQALDWTPRYGDFLDAVKNDPALVPSVPELIDLSPR